MKEQAKRKPGRPVTTGRTVRTCSITLPHKTFHKLERIRGKASRGAVIASLINFLPEHDK